MNSPGIPDGSSEQPPTTEQLRVLRHMLGIDKRERCSPYRDRYCANPGDPDLQEMARAGLVDLVSGPNSWSKYDHYRTTPRGRELAIESQRAMIPNRARQLYLKFLRIREVCPDLTFGEFLRKETKQ